MEPTTPFQDVFLRGYFRKVILLLFFSSSLFLYFLLFSCSFHQCSFIYFRDIPVIWLYPVCSVAKKKKKKKKKKEGLYFV